MSRMPILFDQFERTRGNLPEFPIINMYAESAPTEDGGIVLQSRPCLTSTGLLGSANGPISCLFQGDGVLDSLHYAVTTNAKFYRSATGSFLGTVDGAGPFSMAGFTTKLFMAGGAQLWSWDGATLAAVAFPDAAYVTKIVSGASRLICLRADTQKFYWSDVLSSTIDALSFATAESQPDRLRDMLFMDDILILFGAETVEFWPNTGDADLPFQPLEGRVFEKGVRATGCAVQFGSTFAWVTNDNQVCISDPSNVASAPWLQAKIAASTACSLWTFMMDGEEFLALRLDAHTYVRTTRAKTWTEFATYGQPNWMAHHYAGGYFGNGVVSELLTWSTGDSDFNATLDKMERRFRAGFALNSGSVTVNNILLRANPGRTTGSAQTVEMRRSLDAGASWGSYRSISLGVTGENRRKLQWTGCGMAGQPGFMAEFRVIGQTDFRVSGVHFNEPFGGIS